jgi:glycosyltransferase involved in cell wall biosynthesis
MAKVEHAGLNNFLFLPYQAKADLPYSLTACDLSLVSVDAGMESLVAPSKLYPALSAGRPIAAICSEGTYLEALLKAGGCGASFRNGDARSLADFIRQLANDHSLAEQMGQSGRQYLLAHFTPEIIGQEYFKLLQAFV